MKVETAAIPTAWSYEIKPGNLILHQNSGMDIWMMTGVDETEEEDRFTAILVCPSKCTANYYGMTQIFTPSKCRLYDGEVNLKQKL
jgi:hypothetical protein|nr:MAG TPA: hypothetical protein [Crassvirales sp.]